MAWDYLKRYAFPVLAGQPNESELRVDLVNGTRIRLYGADNADRLRGGYFNGLILDEYADMRPSIWGEVIRPALSDKKGWAVFIGTPRGRAGLYDIWAGTNQWKDVDRFRLMLKASETGILSAEELAEAARTMTPEQYDQEFECSFDAAIMGAIYGRALSDIDKKDRFCGVPYDPSALVYTAWDLGMGDPTAIWWAQVCGREVHLIDYYESSGIDVAHYAKVVRDKPYDYGGHILPHDAAAKELTSGKSPEQTLRGLGLEPITVQEPHRIEAGINAARLLIPRCWFDAKACERGIEALRLYRYEYDEKLATFKNKPVHDWTSHAADAFRYLAMGLDNAGGDSNFNRRIEYPKLGIV